MTPPPLSDEQIYNLVWKEQLEQEALVKAVAAMRDAQWKKALGEPVAFVGNWGKVEFYEGVFPQLGGKLYAFNQEK